jgi:hypothetical protein
VATATRFRQRAQGQLRMPRKRSSRGYEKLASEDLDSIAQQYGPDDVPVPKVLHDFDPQVRAPKHHCLHAPQHTHAARADGQAAAEA